MCQRRALLKSLSILCLPTTVLAYALGPLFIGPLSEIFGRVRVLQIANAWLILFNFITAWSPNKEAFIIFRFLAGLGGSAPLSIGGGVIGDVWRPEERGQAVAICQSEIIRCKKFEYSASVEADKLIISQTHCVHS